MEKINTSKCVIYILRHINNQLVFVTVCDVTGKHARGLSVFKVAELCRKLSNINNKKKIRVYCTINMHF
jgi:hypothetical protein